MPNNQSEIYSIPFDPVFLSCLPVAQFASLPAEYLFNEIQRLDGLLVRYVALIQEQQDLQLITSLRYCEAQCAKRYAECRQLLNTLRYK